MNKQQLAQKIWASANQMRSKIEASEYKDFINNVNREPIGGSMEIAMLIRTFDYHPVLDKINIIVLCI